MTSLASRLQFMEAQSAFIESRSRMIQYGSIQYPELVDISREASPFADVITYYSWDGTGDMIDLANRANDYPFVEVTQAQHNVPIEWKGLAYDFSDREIGRAMLTGVPLADRKVRLRLPHLGRGKGQGVHQWRQCQGMGRLYQRQQRQLRPTLPPPLRPRLALR